MKLTKQDKAMLTDEFRKVWHDDEKMVRYCTNKTSAYVTIRDAIVTLDKPGIKKDFCFDYGYQGVFDDQDDAWEAANRAANSENYFIHVNIENTDAHRIMQLIDGLMAESSMDESWHNMKPYLHRDRYFSQDDDCRFASVVWTDRYNRYLVRRDDDEELTLEDLTELYRVCFEEQMKFCKRLKTYLKRYGMSKVHTWTYWADE